ncbi:hypothetical protein F5B20DRAFT_576138 [Whalleya microplaca]|nr:hypothetical protein F5B20DRAFT_576138 [Whalleya microplaca]
MAAAGINVVAVPLGLSVPKNAVEVFMLGFHNIHSFTTAKEGQTLWTQGMSDCVAVATIDHQTGRRTMTHLVGGLASDDSLWNDLAKDISPDTTIVIASGTNYHDQNIFNNQIPSSVETPLRQAMLAKGATQAEAARLTFVPFWTQNGAVQGVQYGTLVVLADGRYGRMITPAQQGQGNHPCCNLV